MSVENQSVFVVSGHAADFVWRCGGTIAKYAKAGANVHIVCVTSGARGESGSCWSGEEKPTEQEVRDIRFAESQAAAAELGATVEYLDIEDHPIQYNRDQIIQLAEIMRRVRPTIIMTHGEIDVFNPDHEAVFQFTRWALRAATVPGVLPEIDIFPQPQFYSFESDQSTLDEFRPNIYIDITDVIEVKIAASQRVPTQYGAMGQRYVERADFRAKQIDSFAISEPKYSEGFRQHYPLNTEFFPLTS